MKDYQQVVDERYDKEVPEEVNNSAGHQRMRRHMVDVVKGSISNVFSYLNAQNTDLSAISLLDVGCGNGQILGWWGEKGVSDDRLTGIDLSKKRIERAKNRLPNAQFEVGNILDFELGTQFDVVMTYDVFSHLHTREEILQGMKQCQLHMKKNGIFVWYDIYSADHFNPPSSVDSWGFNKDQFEALLEEAGFDIQAKHSYGRNFFSRYQSIYQTRRFPIGFVKFLEKILPGPPVNSMYIATVRS